MLKITKNTTSNNITAEISEIIVFNFLSVLLSKNSLTKLGKFYPNVEAEKLGREWFALEIFLMIISLSSYYKDNQKGITIAQNFRYFVIEKLVEIGIYSSKKDAENFIKVRLDTYSDNFYNTNKNPLLSLCIQFLKYLNKKDTRLLVNTGEQVKVTLESNLKLIQEAEKLKNK